MYGSPMFLGSQYCNFDKIAKRGFLVRCLGFRSLSSELIAKDCKTIIDTLPELMGGHWALKKLSDGLQTAAYKVRLV